MNRVVGHLDLDYFYAQVEEVENPALKDKPVLVCVYSGRTEDSGVVSTANYLARRYGVKSGIPIVRAKKLLEGKDPKLIPMVHEKYEAYSERVMDLIRSRVDTIEQVGIDEAFFDITKASEGNFDRAMRTAADIKRAIMENEKLTCSVGLATNKVIAKLASDLQKPDGLTAVRPHDAAAFIAPLPVEKLYGVGSKTAAILKALGISSFKELAEADVNSLESALGRKFAVYLHNAASGEDQEPVTERREATQLSRIITLKKDSRDPEDLLAQLNPIVEDVQKKAVSKNLFFRSVSVTGILPDLSTKTRSKTMEVPTNDLTTLRKIVAELLVELATDAGELRRVGVRVGELAPAAEQSSLADFMR